MSNGMSATPTVPPPEISFAVIVDVPEVALRHEYDELVADGYSKTWDEYLKGQELSLLDHASGWWLDGSIAWGVKRMTAFPRDDVRFERLMEVTERMRRQVLDAGSPARIHEEDILEAARLVAALAKG